MISFKEKKILVTGASSGIGREISIHLSELEAKVVLIGRDTENLEKTLSLMKGDGHKYFCFDLENIEKIKDLVDSFIEYDNIKLDGFIHSAGVPAVYPLKVINYPNYEKTLKVNTYSYLELIKYLSRKKYSNENMSILFLSSILTKKPNYKGQISYISTKSAAENLSKSLSLELIKRKIRVNSVIIGGVETKMHENTEKYRVLGNETIDQVTPEFSTIRLLKVREVSNMVMYLMSDCAEYIIGETYYIDGGHI